MYLGEGRWLSMAPPGWPALLAMGALASVTWLVNPVLAALAVLLVHALLREIYPARVARGATLLFALSPWLLFLGMSLMAHVASLVFALIAALGVARARRTGSPWPTLIGGLAIGIVSLIRPLEGLAVALLLGVWSLGARGRSWWRLTPSASLVIGTVISAALVAPYNAALTGSASRFPFTLYSDKYYAPGANDLGFGPNRGLGWQTLDPFPGHGWRDVVVNSVLNSVTTNTELFGWVTGSFVLIAALIVLRRLTRADWWMVAVVVVMVGLHAFYWFSGGPDFAGRYWFFAIVPLCALTVSGVRALAPEADTARARISLGVAALSLSALLTFMPWRAVDKYWHFRRMEPGIARLAQAHGMDSALVLVRGPRHPDYHGAAIFNPLDLRANGTVFAWDRNRAVRAEAVGAYPTRNVWIVDGPTVTGRGYELRAGPLPPGSLAAELPSSDELKNLTSRDRAP
jgi:4-amino-4-deoxy-L-arabinose transferase-like glycosyltransferase